MPAEGGAFGVGGVGDEVLQKIHRACRAVGVEGDQGEVPPLLVVARLQGGEAVLDRPRRRESSRRACCA